jgi:tetratricopeptide (TPR) repeat protein
VGKGYVLSASVVSPADGAVLTAVRESAESDAGLVMALDRLSRSLRERIGESLTTVRATDSLARVTTGSLAALRAYTEAVRSSYVGDYERAVPLLQQATTLDSGFAMAWRKLAVDLANSKRPTEQVVDAASRAYAHRDRLPEVERALATAYYHDVVDYDPTRKVASYRAALELDPNNDVALNNLALELERGRQYSAAESLLVRGIALGYAEVYYLNTIVVQLNQGHYADARATLDRYERAFPRDENVPVARAALVAARQSFDSAGRMLQALLATRPASVAVRREATELLAAVTLVRGKIAQAQRLVREVMTDAEARGAPMDYLNSAIELAWIDLRVRHRPADALRRIDAALGRHPLSSIPPMDRPYSALATLYAAAGRAGDARRLLAQYDQTVPAGRRRGDYGRYEARGAIALADGRAADAIAAFRAHADSADCAACGLFELASAYDRMGRSDSALVIYERELSTPDAHRFGDDATELAATYERLGELYERRGDRPRAIARYQRFVDLWKNADPELQPRVHEVRARIERLNTQG